MVKDHPVREETCCQHHTGFSFRLVARVLLYAPGRKEGNVLFNDTLNTFYLWLNGIRHMVKDHPVREEHCCQHHTGFSF